MAVFPDRIILKNSTDDQSTIESAIGPGGTDEIQQGEIVVGRESGSAQLYTVDANGAIVTISGGGGATALDDLSDVDTTTSAPTTGQVLEWDGSNWVPATLAAGGVTSIIAGTGISVDQATGDVTITATGGGGSGSGATRTSDSGTASSGELTLTGLGSSGQLHTLSTDLDAWVVFYGSAADRTADAGRSYSADPTPGSGVLAEAYVTTSGAILFTPGTGYMNNDTTETAALYLAVRDQAGAAVNATLTVTAYVQGGGGAVDSVNGETGVVSLGIQDMDDFVLNDLGNPQFAYNKQNASSPFRPDPGNYMDNVTWLRLNYTDANGATLFNVVPGVAGSFWYSSDSGANWAELTYTSATLEASTVYFQSPSPNLSSSSVLVAQFNPATTPKAPLASGDILQWNDATSEFNPTQLPNAAETRVLLGIGEYVDDAAAGTGGVASGAMYYNTTSGDYRLKT